MQFIVAGVRMHGKAKERERERQREKQPSGALPCE
jgi:hypothetical protein